MFVDIYETENKYSIIYADPPWRYQDRRCSGAAEHHYPTTSIDDIAALPVSRVAADDCILFMWATYPLLPDALRLIEAWGFTYKTIGFQWIKKNRSGKGWFFGLGRWTRGNTEPCLIATKGKPHRASASVAQIIEYPLGRHSAKPPVVREKILELMGGYAFRVIRKASRARLGLLGKRSTNRTGGFCSVNQRAGNRATIPV